MNIAANRLVAWLRQQITIARPSGQVVRFELRHIPLGAKAGHEVATFDPPSRDSAEDWLEDTAQQVLAAAENDAQNLNAAAPQAYVLLSYRKENETKADARFVLPRVTATEENVDGGYESEPASLKGAFAQQLRHNEALIRLMITNSNTLLETSQRNIERLTQHLEKREEQRVELFDTFEELLSKKQDRELERMKAEQRAEAFKQAIPDLKLLVGAIANKMTGAKALPSGPQSEMLARFFATLTDEQKQAIFGSLRPEQQTGLMEIFQAAQTQEN